MTKRFVLVLLIAFVVPMVLPNIASAQTQNKLVFEIKNVSEYINGVTDEDQSVEPVAEPVTPAPAPVPVVKSVTKKVAYTLPPKITGDARVYMHEPEIRAYICPKLGSRCNTFIAVLKAENGTHECTRDNRGLNRNGSVDIGLAQINWNPSSPYTFEQLQDCKFNLDIALKKIEKRGFQPWYAYTKGAYLKHLPAVLASAKAIALAAEPTITVTDAAPEVAILPPQPLLTISN
ncbi:MAG: hypothetical protein KW802_00790 [Candidatus Doudnabacteria bacterium]|nr:hypothetical protein [Candidatus Doudnabacteria bacterium]